MFGKGRGRGGGGGGCQGKGKGGQQGGGRWGGGISMMEYFSRATPGRLDSKSIQNACKQRTT